MKFIFRVAAAVLFIIFFGFALKNTQEVALRFFLDYEIRGPLVLLLLGFFAGGAALGVLAMTPTLFRYRRDLSRQSKNIDALQKQTQAQQLTQAQPPRSDTF